MAFALRGATEPEHTPVVNLPKGSLKTPDDIQRMFDRIVKRYDLMNMIMTGGHDRVWRQQAATIAASGAAECVLDVATGTGDLAHAIANEGVDCVIGLDFSSEMIREAERKFSQRRHLRFITGDALKLPFPDDTFDACTIGFGLRNMQDYQAALVEMTRVIRPGGAFVCLEATPFRYERLRGIFNFYFGRVVPIIGGILSGDYDAYKYLPTSVTAFPDALELAGMMSDAGLVDIRWKYYGAGSVALHVGVKQL